MILEHPSNAASLAAYARRRHGAWFEDIDPLDLEGAEPTAIALVEDSGHDVVAEYRRDEADDTELCVISGRG